MLTSLLSFCGSLNLIGIANLSYLPVTVIDTSNYSYYLQKGDAIMSNIPIANGYSWLNMPILPIADNEQFYDETANADGTATVNITLIYPVNNPAVRKVLRDMQKIGKFVVRLADRNGEKVVLGALPYPLFFSYQYQSNRGAFILRFSGRQPSLASGYTF